MKTKPDRFLKSPNLRVNLSGVKFPLEYLYRGMLITGAPGSGKTRCVLIPMLEEILRATGNGEESKAGMVIIDPKNELLDFVKDSLNKIGRICDLQVLQVGEATYNPFSSPFLTETECVEKIISFASNRNRNSAQRPRGDDLFWANAMRSMLSAIVSIARSMGTGHLSFSDLNQILKKVDRSSDSTELVAWLREKNIEISEAALQCLDDFYKLPMGTTRPCVFTSVFNLLYFWDQSPLRELVQADENVLSIDPIEIIDAGKILVVSCSSAAYGASISPFLLALKEHFFTGILSRDQIELSTESGWRQINQTRPVFLLADEFQSYLSPDSAVGEIVALDRLRGFNAGMVAATQNLASLHSVLGEEAHAVRLISLFANQLFLANVCPYTASQAGQIMGRNSVAGSGPLAPPLLDMSKSWRSQNRKSETPEMSEGTPRVTPTVLSKLQTGEIWMRLSNGQVFFRKAPNL